MVQNGAHLPCAPDFFQDFMKKKSYIEPKQYIQYLKKAKGITDFQIPSTVIVIFQKKLAQWVIDTKNAVSLLSPRGQLFFYSHAGKDIGVVFVFGICPSL